MANSRGFTSAALGAAAFASLLLWLRSRRRRAPPFPEARAVEDALKRGLRGQELPRQADAVVIGAGPSGLALAVMLGRKGRRVLVLEQHDRAGGGLHTFTEKGFDFETGFHYGGELQAGDELRAIIDALTGGEVEFAQLEHCTRKPGLVDRVTFPDGHSFEVPAGRAAWLDALRDAFPSEREAIAAYHSDMRAHSKTAIPVLLWRSLNSAFLRRLLYRFVVVPSLRNAVTAADRLGSYTQDKRLTAVLGYLSLGCAGMPLPAIDYRLVLGMHAHFSEGASFPVGGPSAVAAAMVRQIERQGGRVFVRARVKNVLFDANGSACGVELKDGLTVRAPAVVSSIGVHGTLQLLKEQPCHSHLSRLIEPLRRSHGHIFLFVGLTGTSEELMLPRSNLWVMPGEDLSACSARFLADADAPFGYIGIAFPSAKDPSHHLRHPGRSTAALVAGDVPWEWFRQWSDTRVHHRGQAYESFKDKLKDRLLEVLCEQYPQLRGHVEHVVAGTPLDTNFYLGKTQGESYGLQPTLEKGDADLSWLFARPEVPEWPKGFFLAGQDLTCAGFASAVSSAILATCAVEGWLQGWLSVASMLGFSGSLKAVL